MFTTENTEPTKSFSKFLGDLRDLRGEELSCNQVRKQSQVLAKCQVPSAKCQLPTSRANSAAQHYHGFMNLGMPEMIFIFLLALVVVGPRKLPELGRQLGKFLAEFKRASNEFKNQLETEMLNIELEERAKKIQEGQVLPAEEPWERLMRPITETVSRTRSELLAAVNTEPIRRPSPAPVPEEPAPPAKSASGE